MPPRDAPPRLGRGLAALFGELADNANEPPRVVRLTALEPSPFQPRTFMDPGPLDELAMSIRARGVLQPILVRPHPDDPARFQIIAGERRWRAADLAGLAEIPVLVRDLADADAMAAGLVENLQRRDLNAIEEAQGLQRLMAEFRLTQDQLGQAIGKSRSHVANSLRLLGLPAAIQNHVSAGRLSAGHARAALAHSDPERAAEAMLEGNMSVRDAERMAAGMPARPRPRQQPPAAPDADLAHLTSQLSERLGLHVSIRHNTAGGRLSIHYTSLDQLDHILALIG